jgi:hypothetical protein
MEMDGSDTQAPKAHCSIRESFEPPSNATVESAQHSAKQFSQRTSTDDGMQMDASDEDGPNALNPIRDIFDPGSNATVDRLLH